MKASELLRILQQDGWYVVRQHGSHYIMRHPFKSGIISMPYHGAKEVGKGFLIDTLKKAKINLWSK
jgi:predicted RNA binding protein YcfA (HicA-like mRNA interferase family)